MICRTCISFDGVSHVSTMPRYFGSCWRRWGFTEVAPGGMVDFSSHYLRSTAVVSTNCFRPITKGTALRTQISRDAFTSTAASSICLNWLGLWLGDTVAIITAHTTLTPAVLKDRVRGHCYQWLRRPFVIKAFSWRGVAQTMEVSSRLFLGIASEGIRASGPQQWSG
jgi:hypothetical protein